jgi:hypothetical protein
LTLPPTLFQRVTTRPAGQSGCAQRNYFRPKTAFFALPAFATPMFHAQWIDLYGYFVVAFF